jgi:hypothetical protein
VTSDSWKNLRRAKERNKNENRIEGKFKCERILKDDLEGGIKTKSEDFE